MKKILCLLGLLLFCGFLFSCSSDEDEEEAQNLGWYLANGKVYLAAPKIEKTAFIQIYRQDETGTIYNIGEIIPNYALSTISYAFEDELAANRKYQYMALYILFTSPGYFMTDWTESITVTGSAYTNDPAPVVNSAAYLDYDTDTLRMTMTDGSISFQDETADSIFEKYKLGLVVKNGSSTHYVKLGDKYDDDTSTWDDFLAGEDLVMDSVLPGSWQNTDLSLVGAIYQKEEYFPNTATEDNYLYKTIYWSKPAEVKIKSDGKELTSFTVVKGDSSENGFIYTPPIEKETKE